MSEERHDDGVVPIPKWFLRVVSVGISAIVLIAGAAIPWAASVNTQLTKMSGSLDTVEKVSTVELTEMKRRIETLEQIVEKLRGK